jgi:uncharacterized membrane protein YjgN (DUF898 family)
MNSDNNGIKRHGFEFTGDGYEFFKIWIVNICLTILTLGIYSAWAKVRTHRYFYGNTRLAGASFEYLADPVKILKGRILAVIAFIAYSVLAEVSPGAAVVLFLAFWIALPWVVVQALTFKARYSAYRNIRFSFRRDYAEAYKVFLLYLVLVFISLGLAYPFFKQRVNRFIVNHSAYGRTHFFMNAGVDDFYALYFKVFLLFAGLGLGLGITTMALSDLASDWNQDILIAPIMAGIYFLAFAYLYTRIKNLVFSTTNLGEEGRYRFFSDMSATQVAWLFASNTVMIVLTLGLFIPWAKVRIARYRASRLCLYAEADFEEFIAAEQENISALGEEIDEVFDIDIGI